jgi:antitoxin component YwqK of YwqJK toxin-antitoxin module
MTVFQKASVFCFFGLALINPALSQLKVVTYHDSLGLHVKAVYFFVDRDSANLEGPFQQFHLSGTLEAEGRFENGEKHGLFTEYYSNGTTRRTMHFESGLRNGPVEVFDEGGPPRSEGVL